MRRDKQVMRVAIPFGRVLLHMLIQWCSMSACARQRVITATRSLMLGTVLYMRHLAPRTARPALVPCSKQPTSLRLQFDLREHGHSSMNEPSPLVECLVANTRLNVAISSSGGVLVVDTSGSLMRIGMEYPDSLSRLTPQAGNQDRNGMETASG